MPLIQAAPRICSTYYEIDLRRDGAVTVNGIPFDMLLPDSLSPE